MAESEVLERASRQRSQLTIIDCDIHPVLHSLKDLDPFLSARWREHRKHYRSVVRRAFPGHVYHRMTLRGMRVDSVPPTGGAPGSDLAFMQSQHLDANGVEYGMLQPLSHGGYERNPEYTAAVCSAYNDWQLEFWCNQDKRLKGTIAVNPDFPESAVAEIDRRADDKRFCQVSIPPRAADPLGHPRYWPVFEACARNDIPMSLHTGGVGGHASTGSGWPTFYIEEYHSNVHSMQALMNSIVMSGVLERWPNLKIVLVEGGFAWVPSCTWRLDKHWAQLRDEVPHVKKPPSEYVKRHFWYTTQPIEEPENPDDLLELIDWIGWDRMLYSTDYPHWDFDDPRYTFKAKLDEDRKQQIFRGNAKALYRLP